MSNRTTKVTKIAKVTNVQDSKCFVFFAIFVAFVVTWSPLFEVHLAAVRQPVFARHAMVIAQQPADEAGLAVLRRGGNAVDAAIAVGFALNAVYPYAGALGGGGFMLVRMADGRTTFIDFREKAPGLKALRAIPNRPASG